jgi:hypothetical protein
MNIFTKTEKGDDGTVRKKAICNFFSCPSALYDALLIDKLSGAGMKLVCLLYRLGQKHSAVVIELPDAEAAELTGMDRESMIRARKEIVNAGLVTCSATIGRFKAYTILNPETKQPLPKPSQDRLGVRRYTRTGKKIARTAAESAGSSDTQTDVEHVGSSDTQCRIVPHPLSDCPPHTQAEVPENAVTFSVDVSLKDSLNGNSEQHHRSDPYEVAERESIETEHLVPWSEIGFENSSRKSSAARFEIQPRTYAELRACAEAEPIVRKLREKFGARIRAVVDIRS